MLCHAGAHLDAVPDDVLLPIRRPFLVATAKAKLTADAIPHGEQRMLYAIRTLPAGTSRMVKSVCPRCLRIVVVGA
jgi:hypothetical protein